MSVHPMFEPEFEYVLSFSGGQDSTTCLMKMLSMIPKHHIHLLSFSYGQTHAHAEATAQEAILHAMGMSLSLFRRIIVPSLGKSALTEDADKVGEPHPLAPHLPASFVPGRNLLFTIYAAQYAHSLKATGVVLGVNAVDYSGYPDCRPATMRALVDTVKKGMDWEGFRLITPLIDMKKSEIIKDFYDSSKKIGMTTCEADKIMALTHTCYRGVTPGCGTCPACIVRKVGFADAGIIDPRFKEV